MNYECKFLTILLFKVLWEKRCWDAESNQSTTAQVKNVHLCRMYLINSFFVIWSKTLIHSWNLFSSIFDIWDPNNLLALCQLYALANSYIVLKLLEPGKSCSNKRFTDIWVKSFLNVHSYWNCTNFWLALRRTKERRRFRKILWPSQNIWTLKTGLLGIGGGDHCSPPPSFWQE